MPDGNPDLSLLARLRILTAPALVQWQAFVRGCLEDIPLLTRIASHVGLVLLMVLTVAASNVRFSTDDKGDNSSTASLGDDSPFEASDAVADTGGFALPVINPLTNIPKRTRREVEKYTVQSGDTVSDIASEFDISADSVLWANAKLEDNPDMLSVGQVLNIPPVTGVLYTVQKGDTIAGIAAKFKNTKNPTNALVQSILNLEFNQGLHDLKGQDYVLTVGQFLMVPGGSKPFVQRVVRSYSGPIPPSAARGSGNFGWPVSGRITQNFWTRHSGIDVGAPKGTPVKAADSGYVTYAGWDNERVSYGNMILINHGNGYVTRYAHLSAFNVDVGDSVKKGQVIGRVGSTGNSTGPHLHFEVIQNGVPRNPFGYLH